jgi:hypothetical protein
MKFSERLRVLPMLLIVAGLCFTVRLGEFVTGINHAGSAFAQQEMKPSEEAVPPPLPSKDAVKDDAAPAEKSKDKAEEPEKGTVPGVISLPTITKDGEAAPENETEWRDSGEEDFNAFRRAGGALPGPDQAPRRYREA